MAASVSSPQTSVAASLLRALENPEYVWRTVKGLATDTGLTAHEVQQGLSELPSDVLVATNSPKGRLYSTRSHYRQYQSVGGKILSAFSDALK